MTPNDTPTPSSPTPAEANDPMAGRCSVATGSALSVHRVCDPEHQDLVNMLNNMARASLEGDEKAYDGFYFRAMEIVDELHAELSRKAGWPE